MLKPLAMQHASLWLLAEDAGPASLALARSGVFNPDDAEGFRMEMPEPSDTQYRETYLAARSRLDKILAHCGHCPAPEIAEAGAPAPLADLEALNARLGAIWQRCFAAQEAVHRLEEERARLDRLLQTLDTFSSLDIDLGALLGEHRFLDVRVGAVPSANLARLRPALQLAGFVLDVFDTENDVVHCIIVGPAGKRTEVTALLHSAGWHTVEVPPELRTTPQAARAELQRRRDDIEAALAKQRTAMASDNRGCLPEIDAAEATLALAAPYAATLEKSVRGRGGLVLITGWVPRRSTAELRGTLDTHLKHPYLLKLRDPEPYERPRVPTIVRQPALLRGFAQLVHTYGVPRYGEIDPTWLFAISFALMFGMMFGDVGHGLILACAGLLLRGKLAGARVLMLAAGGTSAVFGVLYGSVFGAEHWIEPLWQSPMADPLRVLTLAVWWGIGFIVVASLIKAHNLYAERGLTAALFDAGGGAGIVLYLGAIGAVYGWVKHGEAAAPALAAMALGATAIFAHAWREGHGPAAERLLVAAIETFEAAIGYFANTLSFMRVGAFSLNHVALALAVFTVADMLGGTGQWVALVVGNLFILVLEGAIVAIQALRLEYYEGFSRFFSGDGREFHPLLLRGNHR